MGCAALKNAPAIRLHVRCENCLREKVRDLELPPGVAPPNDIDDLVEGGYLNNMPFSCAHCDSIIGRLVGISGGYSHG